MQLRAQLKWNSNRIWASGLKELAREIHFSLSLPFAERMAVGGCCFSSDDVVIKSPTDRRLYRLVKLRNGLSALLVHDPEIYPDGPPELVKTSESSDEEEQRSDDDDEEEEEGSEEDGEIEEEEEVSEGDGCEEKQKDKRSASQTKKVSIFLMLQLDS